MSADEPYPVLTRRFSEEWEDKKNMVKLTGPAASIGAGGSLAKLLTFSSSKGTKYLKRHAKPKQPRTPGQVSIRAAMTFLSAHWKLVPQLPGNTWTPAAVERQISPFNAYISANCLRHRNAQGMSIAWPPTEVGSWAALPSWHSHSGVRQITIDLDISAVNQNWYFVFHHVTGTGVMPTWDTAVGLLPTYLSGWHSWTWSPIPAGTYWFTATRSTTTGKMKTATAWLSAIATD